MEGRTFRLTPALSEGTVIGAVTTNRNLPPPLRSSHILAADEATAAPQGFAAYLARRAGDPPWQVPTPWQGNNGDVLRLGGGRGEVLFRRGSKHNTLLLTERCNCACEMCVQPPRESDDEVLLDGSASCRPSHRPRTRRTLGLSGGEPTLLRGDLVEFLRLLDAYLPRTHFHLLSNARLFRLQRFAADVAAATRGRLTVGVPLHADLPRLHDTIAGSPGAFDETIRGVLNLHRHGIAVEVRVVLTSSIAPRVSGIARFVRRSFPFACHVAFMAMETVGWARTNAARLWIDPLDYMDELSTAVQELDQFHIPVSLYNLQRCILPPGLRGFAERSISDWKVDYLDICSPCTERAACCGFFGTDGMRASRGIRPFD